MHGVKRLFGWMIPRFDPARYNVSLVSLRRKDLSEETLDALGIDITYLQRVEVRSGDAARPAEGDRPQADRHPAPARLRRDDLRTPGGADARHSGDPARARQPDRHAVVSEDRRPLPGAVHRHRDRGVEAAPPSSSSQARADPGTQGEDRCTSACRSTSSAANASRDEIAQRATRARTRARRLRRRHGDAPARLEGQLVSRRRGARRCCAIVRRRRFVLVGEGPLLDDLQAQAAALGLGDRFIFHGFARDVAAVVSRVRPERVPVAVGRHAADGVRGAGDGEADRRDRRRRAARRARPTSRTR